MEEVSHLIIKVSSDQIATADKRLIDLEMRSRKTERATDGLTAAFKRLITAAAALAVMKQAGGLLADFEESMDSVEAVTQATSDQMVELTANARRLGADTRYSARQAAEGMKFLGMAGFNTSQIMAAMPGMLDLATAGTLDLARAADIASNIMQGFRMEAKESGRMADVLATAASASNTSVEQLGDGFKYVASIASSMGQTLEDTAALMGALSNAGIQATMAGTGLRQIMSSLVNPTREARDILEAYGFTLDDVNPSMHKMSDIILKLSKANLTAADAFTIAGDRGGNALLALTGATPDVTRLVGVMGQTAGRAKEMARVMGDNLKGDFLQLRSAVEELVLKMGDAGLLRQLRDTTQGLTEFARKVNDMTASGEIGAWVDLVIGKLDLLTDGFYNAAENIQIALNEIKSGAQEIGLGKWLADAFRNMPENIRAATQLIGVSFGTLYGMAESVGKGVYDALMAWFRFFGKSAQILWREIVSQWKGVFTEFMIFLDETSIKAAEAANRFLPKKLQFDAEFFAKTRAEVEKLKESLKGNDHQFIKEQTAAAKAYEDTVDRVKLNVAKNLVSITEAFEEQVTAVLNDRDANIASADAKISKIKELRAAYEAAKAARIASEKENANKAGVPNRGGIEPPESEHFMVKEFEQLRKSLQLEEKSIDESYKKRLELIRKNTKAGSDLRLELEKQLNVSVASEYDRAWSERSARILQLEENLRTAIAEGRASEIEFFKTALENEEELMRQSYDKRKQLILSNTEITEEERNRLIALLQSKSMREQQDRERQRLKTNLGIAADFFGNLSQVASAFGKKGHKAAQALAIAETTIKTYQAATSAYAAMAGIPYVGPVLGAAAAGAAIAAGMANVAAIRSQNYSGAYEHGGYIPAGKVGLVGEAGPEMISGPTVVTSARTTADRGQTRASPQKVTVNVMNYAGVQVETRERDTTDGKVIDMIVKRAKAEVANDIDRGSGLVPKSLERNYGMKRGAAA